MTDYRTISKAEIEALPRCADIHGRESVIKVDDLRALLDKAEVAEPVAWKVEIPCERRGVADDIAFYYKMSEMLKEHIKVGDKVTPLYTSPPQAEARIAELEAKLSTVKATREDLTDYVGKLLQEKAELKKDAEIGKLVRSKMISGNDVPVERCHITRAEIEAIQIFGKG